jgi:hypothetical protein
MKKVKFCNWSSIHSLSGDNTVYLQVNCVYNKTIQLSSFPKNEQELILEFFEKTIWNPSNPFKRKRSNIIALNSKFVPKTKKLRKIFDKINQPSEYLVHEGKIYSLLNYFSIDGSEANYFKKPDISKYVEEGKKELPIQYGLPHTKESLLRVLPESIIHDSIETIC